MRIAGRLNTRSILGLLLSIILLSGATVNEAYGIKPGGVACLEAAAQHKEAQRQAAKRRRRRKVPPKIFVVGIPYWSLRTRPI